MGIFSRPAEAVAPQVRRAVAAKPRLSESAMQVWVMAQRLPDEHRPAYDLEAMLRALDLKYGSSVDSHLKVWSVREHSEGMRILSLEGCTCRWSYDEDGDADEETGRACYEPEYFQLYSAMAEIRDALQDRERVLRDQARAAELAGIEYELRDVEELTKALRAERDIIIEVTEEIFVPIDPAMRMVSA